MFDIVVADPEWDLGVHVPDDGFPADLDAVLERELARAEALGLVEPPDRPGEPAPGYGSCRPSGWLAVDLDAATAQPAGVDDHTLVEAMVGFERLAAWAAARQARLFAELAARRPADGAPHTARWANVGSEYAPDEVGLALRWSRGTACARIGLAQRLLTVLPDTFTAWEAGLIDLAKARAIDDATWMLSSDLARAVQARVLPTASEQTLAQLKAALARAVLAVDPQGAEARHREARRDRRVAVTAEADGMGTLWALLTATDVAGAFTWLTRLARGLGADDPRNMDTRRADILAALLNGRLVVNPDTDQTGGDSDDLAGDNSDSDDSDSDNSDSARSGDRRGDRSGDRSGDGGSGQPGDDQRGGGSADSGSATDSATNSADIHRADARGAAGAGATSTGRPIQPGTPGKPLIQIVIAHSTLTGADDQPAELVGHGPIPAGLARETAAHGVWHRLVTDPLSGALLDYGRTTYHPPAALADHVRARDVHCRKPGCRRKAADGELDHIVPWSEGGETRAGNLAAYCTHDHRLKTHAPGWRVEAHPDGSLTWITPTGHRHTTRPHDYRPGPPPSPPPPPVLAPAPEPAAYDPDADPPPF